MILSRPLMPLPSSIGGWVEVIALEVEELEAEAEDDWALLWLISWFSCWFLVFFCSVFNFKWGHHGVYILLCTPLLMHLRFLLLFVIQQRTLFPTESYFCYSALTFSLSEVYFCFPFAATFYSDPIEKWTRIPEVFWARHTAPDLYPTMSNAILLFIVMVSITHAHKLTYW